MESLSRNIQIHALVVIKCGSIYGGVAKANPLRSKEFSVQARVGTLYGQVKKEIGSAV